jgi:pyruvate/2-oxoglutarate dehydrogenase complex dihydrolipoamide dehydrogenase (E3) component
MNQPLWPEDVHNAELLAQVHPPDWVNPRPGGRYNLVVIGGGTAGLVTAAGAAGLGARVALIERHLLGGDCLNTGCVPSKALLRAARAVFDARQSGHFGVQGLETIELDFGAVMERMRRLRAGISRHDSALRFRDQLGVDVFLGQARFVDGESIEVGGAKLSFDRAAICTGARAAVPALPGLAEAGFLTNETVFGLTALPTRLAVIGAGPIGCELAQAFGRFGSRVTLLQRGAQLLPREDRDGAAVLQSALLREGIEMLLETRVQAVERMEGANGGKRLQLLWKGAPLTLEVDDILVGVGRLPNIEELELDRAGVAFDARGVRVDDRLRTTNPRIFAAGDVCSPLKFTHLADAQARILIANALFLARQKVSDLVVPRCTYTDPEIAQVGLTAAQARQQGIAVDSFTVPLEEVDRAVLDNESEGFARVHLRRGSDVILGATLVGRHAGEMISELTLAMTKRQGLAAIASTIHPYPTQAEAIRKLADAYNRTRLTGPVKKLLGAWLRWRRRR